MQFCQTELSFQLFFLIQYCEKINLIYCFWSVSTSEKYIYIYNNTHIPFPSRCQFDVHFSFCWFSLSILQTDHPQVTICSGREHCRVICKMRRPAIRPKFCRSWNITLSCGMGPNFNVSSPPIFVTEFSNINYILESLNIIYL